ncbi:hypothetical protein Tsubulata_032033 [Turnera subulata]|uniref:Uncharacterized protein n=1 Tax=Turnera subulata TaxID=218843 RepID=A0A9Q0J560_9ROSI|nr:hypothetical protein Tsubulata_032033 [Turnera subulata]
MSLLDQLWDDTVAGPRPDSGLGKLRKKPSLGLRTNSAKESEGGGAVRSYGEEAPETKVTRSIMIVRPPGYASPPVSPAGSTPPVSPFSGKAFFSSFGFFSLFMMFGSRETFRFRRRSASDAYEKGTEAGTGSPSSPYGV